MSLKFSDASKLKVTADTHWCHGNVIGFCNRPFNTIEEHDAALIRNWNAKVSPGDTVIHAGDFAFGNIQQIKAIREQLNGNIILVRGNHDKFQPGQAKDIFDGIYDYLKIRVDDPDSPTGRQNIIICHYAMRVWDQSHYGSYMLYGHSHHTLPDDPNALSIDIGVDGHDYSPLSYNEVKNIMLKKTFKPIDHHEGKS